MHRTAGTFGVHPRPPVWQFKFNFQSGSWCWQRLEGVWRQQYSSAQEGKGGRLVAVMQAWQSVAAAVISCLSTRTKHLPATLRLQGSSRGEPLSCRHVLSGVYLAQAAQSGLQKAIPGSPAALLVQVSQQKISHTPALCRIL